MCKREVGLDSFLTQLASFWNRVLVQPRGPGYACGIISELLLNSSVLPPSLTGHSIPLILQYFLCYSFYFSSLSSSLFIS